MDYFKYTQDELEYLKKRDANLKEIIESVGIIERKVNKDPFQSLIGSVISQQISTKAAITVKQRLYSLTDNLNMDSLKVVSVEELKQCGMSYRKAEYIKGIIDSKVEENINYDDLHLLDDEEIIDILTSLKGVGRWTVEMLLIFSLNRKNILSYDDLGIRRGIMKVYNLESISKKDFQLYRDLYSPYGSIASLYLWEVSVL